MTYDFNYYKEYVHFRVIPESYGYTILRAIVEFTEEYFEFILAEDKENELEELGDVCFWFAWFAKVTDYELHGKSDLFWVTDFDPTIKDMLGCIKRLYRDDNLSKLDEFKEHMVIFEQFINFWLGRYKLTWHHVIESNVAKLDARFGDTFEFNTIA